MPVSNSSDLIAMVSLTWDTRSYQPGDKFKPGNLLPSQRRTVDRMIHSSARKLAELTAENMALALQRRAMGTGVPKGFTLAGLLGLNFITEEQVKRFGWDDDADDGTETADPAKEAGGGEGGETPAQVVLPEWLDKDTEAYPVEDLWVVRQKSNGGPPRYDVNDAKGERVLPGGTIAGKDNAIKKAKAFLEQRGPAPAEETPAEEPPVEDDADQEAAAADLERLKGIAEVDIDAMDADGVRAWLATQDMHGLEDATEEQLREAAAKIRDAAKDAVAELEAVAADLDGIVIDVPRLEDGTLDVANMSDDDLRAFILLGDAPPEVEREDFEAQVASSARSTLESEALVSDQQSDHPSHNQPAASEGNENGGELQSGTDNPA